MTSFVLIVTWLALCVNTAQACTCDCTWTSSGIVDNIPGYCDNYTPQRGFTCDGCCACVGQAPTRKLDNSPTPTPTPTPISNQAIPAPSPTPTPTPSTLPTSTTTAPTSTTTAQATIPSTSTTTAQATTITAQATSTATTQATPTAATTLPTTTITAVNIANLPTKKQRITQTIKLLNLDAYPDVHAYIAAYIGHLSTATKTSRSGINATVKSIQVTVTAVFNKIVSNSHVQTGFAQHASSAISATVPKSAVTILPSGGRRLEGSQDFLDYATDADVVERQLASTTVNGEIDVPSNASADIVTQAKAIHTAMSNTEQVATAVGTAAGVTGLSATTSVGVKVNVQAVLANDGTLDASSINDAIATAFGGNVTGTVSDGGKPPQADFSTNAKYSGGIQFVLVACVLLTMTSRLDL